MNAVTKHDAPKIAVHKNVYMELAAAQMEMGTVTKGAVNRAFTSRYADLADVMQAVLPALNANGLALFHTFVDGSAAMRTTLIHGESETRIECDVPLIVTKNDMQGMKSATTYAKRIGTESVTGVAPDDDDGNAAVKAAPQRLEPPKSDPEFNPAGCRDRLISAISRRTTKEALTDLWNKEKGARVALKEADEPKYLEFVAAFKAAGEKAHADPARQAPSLADNIGDEIPY